MDEAWLQQIQNKVDASSILAFRGKCDSGMTGSTTDIYCAYFKVFGDDLFNDKYYLQVIKNANSVGNAPEKETKKITDFVSSTGKFVTEAFGANVEEGDEFVVIHESLALLFLAPDATLDRVADNSIIAQLMAIDGDVSDFNDNTDSLEAISNKIGTPAAGDLLQYVTSGVVAACATIDISEYNYFEWTELVEINPQTFPTRDVSIYLDLNKATDGWDTISTAADTIDIILAAKIDGTNFRGIESAAQVTATGDGSLDLANSGVKFDIGAMKNGYSVAVYIKLNAERDDAEIPVLVSYTGFAPSVSYT